MHTVSCLLAWEGFPATQLIRARTQGQKVYCIVKMRLSASNPWPSTGTISAAGGWQAALWLFSHVLSFHLAGLFQGADLAYRFRCSCRSALMTMVPAG